MPMTNQQLVRALQAEMLRATARNYRINLDALDAESLREMLRFLRDIEHEKHMAARKAQLQPWRRP